MEIGKCYVCKSFLGQKSSVIHEAEENDCYELCDACSNNLQGLLTKSHRDIIFNFINQPERSKREDSRDWISCDEQEPFCFNSVFLTDGKKVWFDKSYEWSTYSIEHAEGTGPTHWISPLSLLPFIEESLKKRIVCQHPCEMRCSEHCGNTVRDK